MEYYGIADAYGIESFLPKMAIIAAELTGKTEYISPTILTMRANANRHRHAVVYEVDLDLKDVETVNNLIKEEKFIEALVYVKEKAKTVSLAKMPGAEKSWRLIPNKDLDPYGG